MLVQRLPSIINRIFWQFIFIDLQFLTLGLLINVVAGEET